MGEFSPTLVPFALVAFFLTLGMLAAQKYGWAGSMIGFSLLAAGVGGAAIIVGAVMGRLLPRHRDPAIFARVAFALLILAWGPYMAVHLANIPELDVVQISALEGSGWNRLLPSAGLGLLPTLQIAIILVVAFPAAIALWRIRRGSAESDKSASPWAWKVLTALCVVYVLAALVLTLPRGAPV